MNPGNRITSFSPEGLDFIARHEGVRLSAYQCEAGRWTIGVGTTRYPGGAPVRQGDRIDRAKAMLLFQIGSKSTAADVDRFTRDDISQHEFDALGCLCYNIGWPAFSKSTVLRLVNRGNADPDDIIASWMVWDKVRIDGRLQHSDGLYNRRKSEALLFTTGKIKFY